MTEPESSIESVVAEYLRAVDEGQPVSTEDFLSRYPDLEIPLREFFETQAELCELPNRATAQAAQEHISFASNPPRVFGDYKILGEIDRGGMGVVYKARHQRLDRIVALKVIRSGQLATDEEVARFQAEAEAAATLTHPGIVPIYEVGARDGLVFYTMAFIEGLTLAELVERDGAMDPESSAKIVFKLCEAVSSAHAMGIYHRDLKPANVLVDSRGQPIIIDFGLAKIAHRDSELTATGQILGTPAYLAPELASGSGNKNHASADVYALGAILYFLCAGQPAFSGPTPFDVLLQVLDRRPPAPSKLQHGVGKSLDYICERALEKDPDARYASARNLSGDLQRFLSNEPIDIRNETLAEVIHHWWQREPILVAHLTGIGVTALIVAVAYALRGETSTQFSIRMALLIAWMIASCGLQWCVYRARWRELAISSWLTVDVVIYTTLIAFAQPPRSMLLIGYPMMVVASTLFYQRRYVVAATALCCVAFGLLIWMFPKDDFVKPDFAAIFACGLLVISSCMLAVIRRVRGLSRFYEAG